MQRRYVSLKLIQMPGTAVETPICDICGAEVRGGSQFCYNCGGSVGAEAPLAEKAQAYPSDQNGHISESPDYDRDRRRAERADRRRVRASNRKPVELEWEPRTGVSWPFVVGSIVFLLVAALLILAAFYIR